MPEMANKPPRWQRRLKRLALGARNALEVIQKGRLGAPYQASFEVVRHDRVYKLRHYHAPTNSDSVKAKCPILLIPPLMVTSEIYDISPELSAVTRLCEEGLDVWLVDFGSPEHEEGGMQRTLDDHVRAVSDAVDRVSAATGNPVHLVGYSQGGMFAYQAAAYRRSKALASLITFGSPVDIHRNLPAIGAPVAEKMIDVARSVLATPLEKTESLPGALTSTGFKVLSARKEIKQFIEFVQKLHDRQALEKREQSRRFLAGEGFVAWPGPALRKFVDEFIVNNRMTSGGFIIDGRTVSLADIHCPILYFVGETDDIARAPSVRAIKTAAPNSEVFEVAIRAGHFGLVVGSKALRFSWPTVIEWVRWREQLGERPSLLPLPGEESSAPQDLDPDEAIEIEEATFAEDTFEVELFYDQATHAVENFWKGLGDVSRDVADVVDTIRWQLPRLAQLQRMEDTTRISFGKALSDQAKAIPHETFFLWQGRAFSYAEADQRVDNVVRGLVQCGVKPKQRVGVLMDGRPSLLTVACALSRVGAVAVLIGPNERRIKVDRALALGEVELLITDPENADRGRELFKGPVLVLGGGGKRAVTEGVIDMEAIDPAQIPLPSWYEPNPGRAADLAMILFTAGEGEEPHAARVTNRRWAFSALGAAATCSLTSKDTVYCCLPLYHAAGMLVAVGGALVGGSRLAVARRFSPANFWSEVRRYGASVVFYAGDMCRALVLAPSVAGENKNPVRLFAGSGIRADVWRKLVSRFDAGVLDFYASTEGNAVLANASGEKIGAAGRPMPGSAELALVAYDFATQQLVRDQDGHLVKVPLDEPGVLLSRIGSKGVANYDGYTEKTATDRRIVRDAFGNGDSWFVTSDLLKKDADGDYWYVDRVSEVVRTLRGPVATLTVEDTLHEVPGIAHAVVHSAAPTSSQEELVATIVESSSTPVDPQELGRIVTERLTLSQRPQRIKFIDRIPMTDGYRPLKMRLRSDWASLPGPTWHYDETKGSYTTDTK